MRYVNNKGEWPKKLKESFNKNRHLPKGNDKTQRADWKKLEVREALEKLYKSKCAYCERNSGCNEVEHYRPQSKYPWLFYEWSNLLLACNHCNKNKNNQFPTKHKLDKEIEGAFDFLSDELLNEGALIIHPEYENPELYLTFHSKDTDNLGKINEKDSSPDMDKSTATIEVCKLNQHFLIIDRKKHINDFYNDIKKNIKIFVKYDSELKVGNDFLKYLFKIIFDEIKEFKENSYTLLGKEILEKFDDFFIKRINIDMGEKAAAILEKAFKLNAGITKQIDLPLISYNDISNDDPINAILVEIASPRSLVKVNYRNTELIVDMTGTKKAKKEYPNFIEGCLLEVKAIVNKEGKLTQTAFKKVLN